MVRQFLCGPANERAVGGPFRGLPALILWLKERAPGKGRERGRAGACQGPWEWQLSGVPLLR